MLEAGYCLVLTHQKELLKNDFIALYSRPMLFPGGTYNNLLVSLDGANDNVIFHLSL